jgi:hypothetical protein
MANGIYRLSPKEVESLSEPGRYADGGGLYLWVRPSTRKSAIPDSFVKSWLVRMQKDGRRRDIGLWGLSEAETGSCPQDGRSRH